MNIFSKKIKEGFTLIELLVVVAIIGLLATLSIVALNTARDQSRKAKTNADLSRLIDAIIMAQGENGKTLLKITGSNCSDCGCRGIGSITNISAASSCYLSWQNVVLKISEECGGLFEGIKKITRDPWGSPYLLDENEGESGGCGSDSLKSAGPDGLWGTFDDISRLVPKSNFCP